MGGVKMPMPYGNPRTYPGHSGVDFPQNRGTAIRASGPGVVLRIPYTLRGGYWTTIRYDVGVTVGYAHQDRPATDVKAGDRVREGTIIGRIGSKGLLSTGPHLHMEIIGAGTYAAVWQWFDRTRVVGVPAAPAATPQSPPATPEPAPVPEEEEDDMPKNSGVWYRKDKTTYVYLVFNTGSGFAHEFSNGTNRGTMPGKYTAGLKAAMDIAGWSEVTLSHANVIKAALLAIRPKDAPREIEVTVVSQAELDALS